jgi:transcriptional regulator with XRE-family HTH domain
MAISDGGMMAMSEGAVKTGGVKRPGLAQRRKAVGLTQEQLADQLGVERTTVVRWEGGQTQPLPWLRPKLAKALGVSADRIEELLAGGGAPAGARDQRARDQRARDQRARDQQARDQQARDQQARDQQAPDQQAAVPRQLPAAVADFTGRTAELEALTRLLDQAGPDAPGTVVISAIGGTAGVGKTALALRWAHQVAARFPDGQLHVNLRGYDPDQPTPAADALAGLLRSLG